MALSVSDMPQLVAKQRNRKKLMGFDEKVFGGTMTNNSFGALTLAAFNKLGCFAWHMK